MRTVRLTWKARVPKYKRAAMVQWIRKHYDNAKDRGSYVELRAGNRDTKFIWIFMLSKTFRDME